MTNSRQSGSEDTSSVVNGDAPDTSRELLSGHVLLGCMLSVLAIGLVPDVLLEIFRGLFSGPGGLSRDSTLYLSAGVGFFAATIALILFLKGKPFAGRWFIMTICILALLPHTCVSGLGLLGESLRISRNIAEAPGIVACNEQAVSFNRGPVLAEGYLRDMPLSKRFGAMEIQHRLVREGFQFIEERAIEAPSGDFRDRIAGTGRYIRYELSALGDEYCESFYHHEDDYSLRLWVDRYAPRNLRSAHWPGVPRGLCIAAKRTDTPLALVVIRRDDFVLDNGVKGWRTTVTDAQEQVVAEEKSFVIWEASPPNSGQPRKTCQNLDPELSKPASMRRPGYSPYLDPDRVIEPAKTLKFTAARQLEAASPVRRFYSLADARQGVDVAKAGNQAAQQTVNAEIVRTTSLGETISLAEFNKRYPNPANTLLGSVYSRDETIHIHDESRVMRVSVSDGQSGITYWGGVQWATRRQDGLVVVSGLRVLDSSRSPNGGGASASFRIIGIDGNGRIDRNILAEFGPRYWLAPTWRKPIEDVSIEPGGLRIRFLEFDTTSSPKPQMIQLKQEIEVLVPVDLGPTTLN